MKIENITKPSKGIVILIQDSDLGTFKINPLQHLDDYCTMGPICIMTLLF